jgi:hypothetical protein
MRLPEVLAQLGTVLELRVENGGKRSTLTWPRGSLWLCTDAAEQRLYLVPCPKTRARKISAAAGVPGVKEAARAHRRWSEFEPGNINTVRCRGGKSKRRGRVASIAYRSDKWDGRAKDYEHQFTQAPQLRQVGTVYVISGGGLAVSPSGIRG